MEQFAKAFTAYLRQVDQFDDNPILLAARKQWLKSEKSVLKDRLHTLIKAGRKIFDNREHEKTLMLAVDESLINFFELCMADARALSTLQKKWATKHRIQIFLKARYKLGDLPLPQYMSKAM